MNNILILGSHILESHVEYCWIDMPACPRETGVPAPLPRAARLESLLAQPAAAETAFREWAERYLFRHPERHGGRSLQIFRAR